MLLPQDLKFSGEKCAKRVILFKKNLQLCVKTIRYNMQKCVKIIIIYMQFCVFYEKKQCKNVYNLLC